MKKISHILTGTSPMHDEQQMHYCGVGRRFFAYLLDVLVQVVFLGSEALLLEEQSYVGLLGSGLILFACSWLYFTCMESSKYQATLGKLVFGIKVVNLEGNPLSFSKASSRYFAKLLSRLTLGLGCLVMFFNQRKQCLHDKLASTIVVHL